MLLIIGKKARTLKVGYHKVIGSSPASLGLPVKAAIATNTKSWTLESLRLSDLLVRTFSVDVNAGDFQRTTFALGNCALQLFLNLNQSCFRSV